MLSGKFNGPKARQIRESVAGLTLFELANMVGVSESVMSRYERGQRQPSGPVFVAICSALKVDASELLILPVETAESVDESTVNETRSLIDELGRD